MSWHACRGYVAHSGQSCARMLSLTKVPCCGSATTRISLAASLTYRNGQVACAQLLPRPDAPVLAGRSSSPNWSSSPIRHCPLERGGIGKDGLGAVCLNRQRKDKQQSMQGLQQAVASSDLLLYCMHLSLSKVYLADSVPTMFSHRFALI